MELKRVLEAAAAYQRIDHWCGLRRAFRYCHYRSLGITTVFARNSYLCVNTFFFFFLFHFNRLVLLLPPCSLVASLLFWLWLSSFFFLCTNLFSQHSNKDVFVYLHCFLVFKVELIVVQLNLVSKTHTDPCLLNVSI